ncbi:MAG: TIGR00266 family protein [Methanosarcinales archaeon]|nr:TIGR00266 family protein [ANME-2 cluster archaeon]MDW7775782.1 TIGR00266 family protein [Methanosarcinales archaeon]
MEYEITGDNLQLATLHLRDGETIYAEAGAMNHMSSNVDMQAKAKGGIFKGIKRMVSGESFFVSEFTAHGEGFAAFGGNVPGKINAISIGPGKEFLAQRDAFLCAESGIDMDVAFTKKLGAGFFGGEGFILQKYSGQGTVFIHACGDFVVKDLKPGETLKVDTGSVVGFDSSVQYDITRAGGIKTSLFGGEGLFLTTLTGPGKVIIQSLSIANLAAALAPHLPIGNTGSSGSGGLSFGKLLGD